MLQMQVARFPFPFLPFCWAIPNFSWEEFSREKSLQNNPTCEKCNLQSSSWRKINRCTSSTSFPCLGVWLLFSSFFIIKTWSHYSRDISKGSVGFAAFSHFGNSSYLSEVSKWSGIWGRCGEAQTLSWNLNKKSNKILLSNLTWVVKRFPLYYGVLSILSFISRKSLGG